MVEFNIKNYFTAEHIVECKTGVYANLANGRRMTFGEADIPEENEPSDRFYVIVPLVFKEYNGEKSKYIKKKLKAPVITATYEADASSIGVCIWKATEVSKHGPDWSIVDSCIFNASEITSFKISTADKKILKCLSWLMSEDFVDDLLIRHGCNAKDNLIFKKFPKYKSLVAALGDNCTPKNVFEAIISERYNALVNGVYNLRLQYFGIEIEFTGMERQKAANVIATYFNTNCIHKGGAYDAYHIPDHKCRIWKIQRDSSITPEHRSSTVNLDLCKCEFVSPICMYDDIPDIQQMVRNLRKSGMRVNASCGIHVHVSGDGHNARSLKNLSNIMASKEELIFKALAVKESRYSKWCKKSDSDYITRLNSKSNYDSINEIKEIWYNGDITSSLHYHSTRYHALNLHSLWQGKGIEFRMYNSTTHAGKVKAYIQFALAICNYAKCISKAKSTCTIASDEKLAFRSWLVQLGLTGDEFKTARLHLLANFNKETNTRSAA